MRPVLVLIFAVALLLSWGGLAHAQSPRGAVNPRAGGAPPAIEQSSRDLGSMITAGDREAAAGFLLGRRVMIRPDATVELSARRSNVAGAWISFENAEEVSGETGVAQFDASGVSAVRLSAPANWPIGPVLVVCHIDGGGVNGQPPTFRWLSGEVVGGEVVSTGTAVVLAVTHRPGVVIGLSPRIPIQPWSLERCELSRVE